MISRESLQKFAKVAFVPVLILIYFGVRSIFEPTRPPQQPPVVVVSSSVAAVTTPTLTPPQTPVVSICDTDEVLICIEIWFTKPEQIGGNWIVSVKSYLANDQRPVGLSVSQILDGERYDVNTDGDGFWTMELPALAQEKSIKEFITSYEGFRFHKGSGESTSCQEQRLPDQMFLRFLCEP